MPQILQGNRNLSQSLELVFVALIYIIWYFYYSSLIILQKDLEEDTLELQRFEDRHFILQIALKCADISNPTRPWDISQKWSLKVCQEFFRQGDYERKLNLPVTSLCDRQSTSIPKIQSGKYLKTTYVAQNDDNNYIILMLQASLNLS